MIKRRSCSIFALCTSVFLLAGLIPAANAALVENLRSYRAPDYTRLVFDLSGPLEHKIFTLENPDRIVIDLTDSQLRDNFASLDLADTPVVSVRSAARNETDARVVLDMRGKVEPRSFILARNDQYGDRLVIDLYDKGLTPENAEPVITAASQALNDSKRDIVVAISAGHGGEDPGAIGVDRIQEKRVVLALAKEMETIINQTPGYRAVMVRDGDYYVDLRRRIGIAHEHNADLFIAVHADAFTSSQARGSTIYALSQRGATSEQARRLAEKENSADLIGGVGSVSLNDKDEVLASVLLDLSITASIASSLEVGDRIISSLGNVARMRRTNVEQAAFVVLKSADIPSLLIEAGYVTNPTDAKNLNSSAYRKRFAGAVVNGITSWFYDTPPRGTWVSWAKENGGITPGSYTVRSGDTLSDIANRFDVSLTALKAANHLNTNTIRVGQTLNLPNNMIADMSVSYTEHTISRGETLSEIASNYSVPLTRIRESNSLNSDTIRVGQVIRIPSS